MLKAFSSFGGKMDTKEIDAYLKKRLREAYYERSLYAIQLMSGVAKVYQLNHKQAIMSGLLHLVSRQMEPDKLIAYAEKHDKKLVERVPTDRPLDYYLTGPASAWFIVEELGERSDDVYRAIRDHTLLFRNPSHLAKCLHVASILAASDQNESRTIALMSDFMAGRLEKALNALMKRDVHTLKKTNRLPLERITNPDFRKSKP